MRSKFAISRERIVLFIVATLIFLGGAILIYLQRTGILTVFGDVVKIPTSITLNNPIDLSKGIKRNLALDQGAIVLTKSQDGFVNHGECIFDIGSPQVLGFTNMTLLRDSQIPPSTTITARFAGSRDGVQFDELSDPIRLQINEAVNLAEILQENSHFVRIACALETQDSQITPRLTGFTVYYEALQETAVTQIPFSLDPTVGQAPLTVNARYQGEAQNLTWDFGDGSKTIQNEREVTHKFDQPGVYIVTLTADGKAGTKLVEATHHPVAKTTLKLEQSSFAVNEKVRFSLTNHGPALVQFKTDQPFKIYSDDGLVFSPEHNPTIINLEPNQTQNFSWDPQTVQQDQNQNDTVYYIELTYFVNGEELTKKTAVTISNNLEEKQLITVSPVKGIAPLKISALFQGELTNTIWDFGDGNIAFNQKQIEHTFTRPGEYEVILRSGGNILGKQKVLVSGLSAQSLTAGETLLINRTLPGTTSEPPRQLFAIKPTSLIATGDDIVSPILIGLWLFATYLIFRRKVEFKHPKEQVRTSI